MVQWWALGTIGSLRPQYSVRKFARFDICQEETVSMAKKASQLAKVVRTTEQQ